MPTKIGRIMLFWHPSKTACRYVNRLICWWCWGRILPKGVRSDICRYYADVEFYQRGWGPPLQLPQWQSCTPAPVQIKIIAWSGDIFIQLKNSIDNIAWSEIFNWKLLLWVIMFLFMLLFNWKSFLGVMISLFTLLFNWKWSDNAFIYASLQFPIENF